MQVRGVKQMEKKMKPEKLQCSKILLIRANFGEILTEKVNTGRHMYIPLLQTPSTNASHIAPSINKYNGERCLFYSQMQQSRA
jgi:hypothetical protein